MLRAKATAIVEIPPAAWRFDSWKRCCAVEYGMALFDTLGFNWDRASVPRRLPPASLDRAVFRFHRMLPEYVWDAGVLEGNPFTFPEVKTVLEGVTVGGRKLSDQEQILNLGESSKQLIKMVTQREFVLEKATFCELHAIVARNEALEWGHFRGEGAETKFTPDVALGDRGRFTPLHTEPGANQLNRVFSAGLLSLSEKVRNPFEKAAAFFFFGALQQFFFDGDKRTSRFMMNGVLMSNGIDAVSVPAARAQEFNRKMVDFYVTRDASEMMAFIVDCHPCAAEIRELNPNVPGVIGEAEIHYVGLEPKSGSATNHPSVQSDENRSKEVVRASEEGESGRSPEAKRPSIDEVRRKAREDWLREYHGKIEGSDAPERDPNHHSDTKTAIEKPHSRHTGLEDDLEG